MDSKANDIKSRARVCPECEHRMNDAANAMRRHGSQMASAVHMAQTNLSEEQRQEIATTVGASFEEAQAAWDVYREHLVGHGLLPAE